MKLLLLILLHVSQNRNIIEQNKNKKNATVMKMTKKIFKEYLKVLSTTEKISTTYSSVNLVNLVSATGNSPERLLALRMLQSPKLKLRSFHVFKIKQINDNLEMTNQNLFEKLREKTQRNSQILQVNQLSKLNGNQS